MAQASILLRAVALLACAAVLAAGARTVPDPSVISRDVAAREAPNLPVVLWHGMGDSCCASYSIGAIAALIKDRLGVYVHSIATGSSALEDVWSSYFGSVNDQVARVCEELRAVPELAGGYNAIGFSQGGQFLRAVAERCQHLGPRMATLVTLGAQHQGVINVPGCNTVPENLTALVEAALQPCAAAGPQLHATACETMQALVGKGAYLPWVRDHVVQAQYVKDPQRLEAYLEHNPFLPDINNEKADKNKQYATNLASLKELVLFRFADDTTVVPRDSSWFGEPDPDSGEVVDMRDTRLYKEDWIGLRALDKAGKLRLEEAPGAHMQFSLDWFETEVMWPYLAGEAPLA